MKPFLKVDDTITLHLPGPALALDVYEAINKNRTYLRIWLPWVDDINHPNDTKTFMEESMSHNSAGTRLTTFILYGEKLIGSVGVVRFQKEHRKCEIGYWLCEDHQGRGIITKALRALMAYLFKSKAINRIEVQILCGNERSKGVPLRLGFQSEGIQRQAVRLYDQFFDVELFSILKEDWLLRNEV
ncbi:MAG: GNAT family N-acetyltransferase [Saprospiraceae bacterium]|nr:GNAT family N-acetyltransferase [Saprospiraceae bacterium]